MVSPRAHNVPRAPVGARRDQARDVVRARGRANPRVRGEILIFLARRVVSAAAPERGRTPRRIDGCGDRRGITFTPSSRRRTTTIHKSKAQAVTTGGSSIKSSNEAWSHAVIPESAGAVRVRIFGERVSSAGAAAPSPRVHAAAEGVCTTCGRSPSPNWTLESACLTTRDRSSRKLQAPGAAGFQQANGAVSHHGRRPGACHPGALTETDFESAARQRRRSSTY